MNLSLKWLHDFTNTDGITTKEYCDRMTDTGSKVECFAELGKDIENVLVAKIVKITPHENSDHLQICQVDIGKETVQTVTGAQNVFEGAIVPAAIPVAKLPGDITIKAGKLRGVESNGMLCSMGELGLTEHDMPGKKSATALEEHELDIIFEHYTQKHNTDNLDAYFATANDKKAEEPKAEETVEETVTKAECEKRVSGMQSAMAKQMDAMKKDYEAKIADFQVQIQAKDEELTKARAEVTSLSERLEKSEKELSETASALAEKENALAVLNANVNTPKETTDWKSLKGKEFFDWYRRTH